MESYKGLVFNIVMLVWISGMMLFVGQLVNLSNQGKDASLYSTLLFLWVGVLVLWVVCIVALAIGFPEELGKVKVRNEGPLSQRYEISSPIKWRFLLAIAPFTLCWFLIRKAFNHNRRASA